MRAFHSFWSRPNMVRSGEKIEIPDFELLTVILSALEWQKHNGPITMVTDSGGAEFFRSIGFSGLWDDITTDLDRVDPEIDPVFFWAAGKFYALQAMEMPCVMLDTDLIIWQDLKKLWDWDQDVVAAHREGLNPVVYPDPSVFRGWNGYRLPEEWDYMREAANTAFLYVKNGDFRDHYTEAAIRFCRNIETAGLDPMKTMCFAEQRILPMIAQAEEQRFGCLLDLFAPEDQRMVTHIWGYKGILAGDPKEREVFCTRCAKRILRDFPDRAEELLTGTPLLSGYFTGMKLSDGL